jgi:S1-C subfamily serine protease
VTRGRLAGAALAALLGATVAGADALVNCYDARRDLVQRLPRGDCRGEEVSHARAAEIRARRQERVRRIVTREPEPVAPGLRLGGVGSGFFVGPGGLLLTNLHVVDPCKALSVSTPRGETVRARVEARERDLDLALLRTGLRSGAVAVLAGDPAPPGSRVAVVGYPDRGVPPIKPLLVTGTLRGLDEMPMVRGLPVLGIAADIRRGHSGAPLLDPRGRVIGVLFAKARLRALYGPTGRVHGELGFAIPGSLAATFVRLHGGGEPRAPADPFVPADLLEHARPFVARVECWR